MIRQRFSLLLLCLLFTACELANPSPSPTIEGPTIVDFNASAPDASGSATLSWRVNDEDSLSIDQEVGDVTGQSNVSVSPGQTTTYTLTATNGDGSNSAQVTATVSGTNPNPDNPDENVAPRVEIEEVDPLTLSSDSVSTSLQATVTDPDSDSFTYTWNVTEGEAANVTLGSRNQEDTQVSFSATGSYTLTLTVSDGDKEGKGSVEVEVGEEGDSNPDNPDPGNPDNPDNPDNPSDGTITVTSTSGAASLEDGCTLRAAITAANTDAAVGGCEAGQGVDTIVLAEDGTYTLIEVDNGAEDETSGPSGLPRVTSEIKIEGNGATIERPEADAEPYFRLFYVAEVGNLTVQEVTVRKGGLVEPSSQEEPNVHGANFLNLGSLTVTSSKVNEGYFEGEEAGGVAIHNLGTLTLEKSEVSDNAADGPFSDSSALYNAGEARVLDSVFRSADEGSVVKAVYNAEPGTLEFRRSVVTGYKNFAIFAGIDNDGSAKIVDSAVIDNSSDQDSAGISNGGTMEIERSLISGNSGFDGGRGGIGNDGTLTLINSTVSGNFSEFNSSSTIFNSSGGTIDIRYSTIKDNFTQGEDLGSNDLPPNTVRNEGVVTLHGTVLDNATTNCAGSGTFVSEGYNLDSDDSCNLDQSTDANVDPQLGELEDNGGPTLTHALQAGSPALNQIPADACEVETDQRGVARPQGEACDIGAFELEQ